MFYALFVILFLILFLLYAQHKKKNTLTFTFVLAAYFLAVLGMMLYFSRDTYYYNIVKKYFYLPDPIWRELFFFPISRINIIRFMNLSSLAVILASVYFALSFHTPFSHRAIQRTKAAIWIYLILQYLMYDPRLNLKYYYFLYPRYMESTDFYQMQDVLYHITRCCNNLLILLSVLILFTACYHAPRIQLIRYNMLMMTACFFALSVLYLSFLSRTPAFLMRISKIAGSYYFWYINLGKSMLFYYVFPFILILFLLTICYCLFRLTHISHQIDLEELDIAKQIDASETTSKVFCHYIKNELLAIQAGLELLPEQEGCRKGMDEIITRCSHLYGRIDEIHKSTKTSELHLVDVNLQEVIDRSLLPFRGEFCQVQIECKVPAANICVLADPVYLEQALHNMIHNAIDAMESKLPGDRLLTVELHASEDWSIIDITDTGTGISANNLKKIFTPFFSSKSASTHWGIGLALTYRIIRAHEGRIEVTSIPGKGTTFQILLPRMTEIFRNRSDQSVPVRHKL